MIHSHFERVVEDRLQQVANTLAIKSSEYSLDEEERFSNFIRAASYTEGTPEEALWGMLAKHLVSVQDMVHGRLPITEEMIDEKIGDVIAYMLLLEGMFKENLENPY